MKKYFLFLIILSFTLILALNLFDMGSLFSQNIQKRTQEQVGNEPHTQNTNVREVLQASTVDFTKYTAPPFDLPASDGESDTQYDEGTIARANTLGGYVAKHVSYLQSKFSSTPEYIDPFAAVIWNVAIEGTYANPFAWNCLNGQTIVNQGCPIGGYFSGGWQVNGIQVYQVVPHIVEDFEEVYGKSDAATVKQVGDRIIAASQTDTISQPQKYPAIQNPSTFPSLDLQTIANRAGTVEKSGDQAAQQLIAILLMDPELGAVAVAREIAGDIQLGNGSWKAGMSGYGYTEFQTWSNRAQYLAERYTGSVSSPGSTSGGVSGGSIPPLSIKVRLKPGTANTYILNKATATVQGGSSSSPGTGPAPETGLPGQPLPSNDPIEIARVLCDDYDVCPTAQSGHEWTMEPLTALWNDVQRIAASPAYKDVINAYTEGKPLEIQRIAGGGYWGEQLGDGGSHIMDSSSLIVITDYAITNEDGVNRSSTFLEWLFAHEIGHIAEFAPTNPSQAFAAITNCNPQTVSSYTSARENFAQAVSYYMTNGEQGGGYTYYGGQENLKDDYPCVYNALKDNLFGGVEY